MDKYSLTARTYPMVIFYLPILIVAVIYAFDFEKYYQYGMSIGLFAVLSYFMSHLGRDGGKKKEAELWKSWGGSPTTQLLRWRDSKLDPFTKKRYHDKMDILCPTGRIHDQISEANDSIGTDEVYQAWTKFLLAHTRDKVKFSLLFKDNMGYGFRRNLWGLKPYAISLLIFLIVGTYIYIGSFNGWKLALMPQHFFICEALLLFILFFWLIKINSKWVKLAAFSYAERLHETIDIL